MQDIFGSVRRSLVFRTADGGGEDGTLVDKINSCIRKSKVFSRPSPPRLPQPNAVETLTAAPPIRWRKGELIGCGAFGHVYMGMNLDSGELLAVKQVQKRDLPLTSHLLSLDVNFTIETRRRAYLFFYF